MNFIIRSTFSLVLLFISIIPALAQYDDDDFSPSEAPGIFVSCLIFAGVGWLLEQIKFVKGLGVVLKFIGLFGAAATVIMFILYYVAIVVAGLLRIAFYIAILIGAIWLLVWLFNWLKGKDNDNA